MSQYRTTFTRQPDRSEPPEVMGAADFDSLDAAEAAGRAWRGEDPVLHGYEINLFISTPDPPPPDA